MKPEIIAFTTISLDGGISRAGEKTRLSSSRDVERQHMLRSMVDAVMVGANTVLIDDPLLTVRLPGYSGRQPWRIVVDSRLRTSPEARVYDTSIAPTILVTSIENKGKVMDYEARGVRVVFVDKRGEWLDLDEAARKIMDEYGIRKILVEGGGVLIGTLLLQGLIDKLIVTVSPILLGKNKTPYIGVNLDEPLKLLLEKAEVDRVTGEITLHYRPVYAV